MEADELLVECEVECVTEEYIDANSDSYGDFGSYVSGSFTLHFYLL